MIEAKNEVTTTYATILSERKKENKRIEKGMLSTIINDVTCNGLPKCSADCGQVTSYSFEYKIGIGSRKAAKDFDARIRGTNRYNYSKCKVFWDLVLLMIRRGRQANEANR